MLVTAPEHRTGYHHSLFRLWIDADGDGCDTRREVLIAEAIVAPVVGGGCSLTGGEWRSAYDGLTFTDASQLQIDHVVALAEAWDSGASAWTPDRRMRYANDLAVPWVLIAVSAASNQAKSDHDPAEWLPPDPADLCPFVSAWIAIKVRWHLTPEQARAFLEAASGDRLEALYTVALAVGLRQGEALGLRWDDVDLEAGTLTVRHALQRVGGRLRLVEPKTRLSLRNIALPPMVVAALRAHRSRQLQERLWAGSRWQEHDYVFASTIGTPLDGTNVTHRLQAILLTAGLPRQRFHDLRHACASLLLALGVHPRVVMETLGHSQISLTMNTYGHVLPSLQRDAADRMDRLLR